MLKVKGLPNFVQIYDYKFEELELDEIDEEDDFKKQKEPVKYLKVYILMEKIKGLTLFEMS